MTPNFKTKLALRLVAGAAAVTTIAFTPLYGQTEEGAPPNPSSEITRVAGQVLADLYSEVMYISAPLWLSMLPVAEIYAEILIKARNYEIADDEEATRAVEEAWTRFEETIETMLDADQKAARTARRASRDAWMQEFNTNLARTADTLRQKARTNGSVTFEFGDDGTTRSIY